MPLVTKSFRDFFNSIVGKFNKELPEIDPTIKSSLGRASSGAAATAGIGLQDGIKDAVEQSFWQTADGDFLEQIGEYDKTVKFGAQEATGFAPVGGVLGTVIPVDTVLTNSGNTYKTLAAFTVTDFTGNVGLSFSAGIVTVVTALEHTLSNNLDVTISGATQTDYNGTFTVVVLDSNTFTYELTAGALTTDQGQYSSEYALLEVESENTGTEQNIEFGGQLAIDIVNIDPIAFVGVNGIFGGLEEEEEEDFRVRVGDDHIITPGIATVPAEVSSAKKIAGNTRVFVIRPDIDQSGGTPGQAGYLPILGETVIYILRDNDTNIIPNQTILDQTKQQILDDKLWPSFLPKNTLYVLAPILLLQDFVFTSIAPDTVTMQNAITEQLAVFFTDNAEVGNPTFTISLANTLNPFLRQIQDQTGVFLQSFTYTTPSADIVAAAGEIYTLGTVSFI